MSRAAEAGVKDNRLRRSLRPAGVLALTLAALSPAGSVFVTGAAVLHLAGSGAVIAMLGGGAAVMVEAMLCAELGAAFPHAGGLYHGIGEVLGYRYRAAALALGVVTAPALIAFVALGFATYVRELVPSLPLLPVAIGAIGLGTLVGVLRLQAGMRVAVVLLIAELAALIALIALAWWSAARSLSAVILHPVVAGPGGALTPTGIVPLILGTIAAAYACSGSNLALNFTEEIEGDRRVVGRIVVWGSIVAIMLVALPVIGIAIGTPDLGATLSAEAPIAASIRAIAGPVAARAFAAVVALAILDHVVGAILAYGRFVFAAARSLKDFATPVAMLAQVNRRTSAPSAAVFGLGVSATVLTLIGERGLLFLISGEIVTPTLMIIAVLVGRRSGQTGAHSFRSPGYPVLPYLGLVILAIFFVAILFNDNARISLLILVTVGIASALVPKPSRAKDLNV